MASVDAASNAKGYSPEQRYVQNVYCNKSSRRSGSSWANTRWCCLKTRSSMVRHSWKGNVEGSDSPVRACYARVLGGASLGCLGTGSVLMGREAAAHRGVRSVTIRAGARAPQTPADNQPVCLNTSRCTRHNLDVSRW